MRRLALAAALLLSGALAGPARAGDEPVGDGHLARIRLGWDGFLPKDTVAPVALLFTNPDAREHILRVVVSPEDGERAEVVVTLPPGARKRVRLALRVQKALTVSITEDGCLVAFSRHLASVLPPQAVLVVDGEPETMIAQDVVTGPIAFTTRPEDLPGEVACLAPFNGVILRMLDPSQLDPEVRAGLDDYVRAGGTVVVMGTAERAATRAFYDELPGGEERKGSFPGKRRGLGHVFLEPSDLGAPPDESTGAPAARRAELGQLLLETQRIVFPRLFVGDHPREAATDAALLFAGFLAVYLLVAGPIFMFALRRARPARVFLATVVLLLALVGLGALTAERLLHGPPTIKVFALVVIPPEGEPVVLADVLIQSGGSRSHDLAIEGEDVAATWFGRLGRRVLHNRRSRERTFGVDASTTRRGIGRHEIRFADQPTPVFGETTVTVLASAKAARAIPARVELGLDGAPVVVVENDCGHALGATLVFERLATNGAYGVTRIPHLPAGVKLRVPLTRRNRIDPAAIGIPPRFELVGWSDTQALARAARPPRFVLVAEDDPPITVRVARAEVEEHSWRLQEVAAAPVTTAGYLGITVTATSRGAQITRVAPGSPAEAAGWALRVGRVLTSVAGMSVRSDEDLANALGWAGAGASVRIVPADGEPFGVQLASPPTVPAAGAADPRPRPGGG
jgi:hypothetical protein